MKVLIINSVCGIRSTGKIVMDLYNTIESYGDECCIAYGRDIPPKNIKTIRIGSNFDNYTHLISSRFLDNHGLGSKKVTKEFIKAIEEYNPDVIHLHNLHGYYLNIEILFRYLKKINKKVIWTLHDCWAFTGHCASFDYVGCEKWKYGCDNCCQTGEYPKSIIKDNSKENYLIKKKIFTLLNNMIIVTPSKWLAELVKQSFLKKYDVKVINNGIDLNVFKPVENNLRKKYNLEKKFVILGVASIFNKRKGIDYFIKLSKILDNNFKIILIGVPKKIIKSLPNNIICIERIDNVDELKEFYTMADVFFNPTMEEVFGMTNIESLACGTPVITFNTGGSPECILNEKCGFIVKKGDINEVYKNILRLKNTEKMADKIINSASNFDKEEKYKEYIKLYKA
ncbi:glycosyltransferase [Clostridium perfringens]|uniref:Glycosyltransferase n=1 Tax=Clostridium perfringens TaxID=1502 RepID=A0AAW9IAP5_CLOPF|nr:glycosyltransferase [Clostridium perfringens]MDH5092761.1 GDP-mannose-dependent alpha-(1-6)-phosphatidylinositol monomannoside mannosyltransferase [Clostridium perfringens]MDZ4998780.1 glycosyltransferase [Clostridium perfringens]